MNDCDNQYIRKKIILIPRGRNQYVVINNILSFLSQVTTSSNNWMKKIKILLIFMYSHIDTDKARRVFK